MSSSINQRLDEADIRRIMLPMRSDNPALQHVNGWLAGREVLFDTGKDDVETRKVWNDQNVMAGVTDVYCTHAHADHMGLAHHFALGGARIHISDAEIARARGTFERPPANRTLLRDTFLRDLGGLRAGASFSRPLGGPPTVPPNSHVPLADGERFTVHGMTWRIVLGGGHSVRPALFIDDQRGLLITGDQILPEMTPYVGVSIDAPEIDPLGAMLDFLRSWADIDDSVIALPGHGAPFCDVGRRVKSHLASYDRRLQRAWAAAQEPMTGASLLSKLFRVAPGQQVLDIHYAMAAALLNHLLATSRMHKWQERDGAFLFQRL